MTFNDRDLNLYIYHTFLRIFLHLTVFNLSWFYPVILKFFSGGEVFTGV